MSVLAAVVNEYLARVDGELVAEFVEELSRLDRYQASAGVERAAELIAARAEQAGLRDVVVERLEALPAPPFWTFERPASWTPHSATLQVGALLLDHAAEPFLLATNSAGTPPEGVEVTLVSAADDPRGSVLVFDRRRPESPDVAALAAAGARGFISDHATVQGQFTGRIELPAGTPLFAFSVTPGQLAAIERASRATAHIAIEIDTVASMPVVTALSPGREAGREIWATAHICHPRPSANDNASGAAALIGTAAALQATGRERARSLRFVWAPEFVGTAAALHGHVGRYGPASVPVGLINLDMVGEDQEACGTPFVVERGPGPSSPISTLTEHVSRLVFDRTPCRRHAWHTAPFAGASDHAVLADPRIGCDVVHLCHPYDRFNHSAADTPDKVSPLELRRAVTIAATVAEVVTGAVAVEQWHRDEPARADHPRGLHAVWRGPLNLRAVLESLEPSLRRSVDTELAAVPNGRPFLVNLAYLADGTRDRVGLLRAASGVVDGAVPDTAGELFLEALLIAGAVSETPSPEPWWATSPAEAVRR